ncbi:putative mosc domain-containing protein [Rosellinia necatrix]|uniref:Putative mosc domain-containing protein n=1 Tax=Rosellinia necatrix TaxID=77044 RepID=A0A1S7UHH4_ROSNE|nr:putative mosc domain-containing protein [Rosellinia necatrix]
MKITELYIYPIKSLAPLSVPRARLRRESVEHDRRFMLLKVLPPAPGSGSGSGAERYQNMQIPYFPECALFRQRLEGGEIVVTYRVPARPLFAPGAAEQRGALRVPLAPGLEGRGLVDVSIGGSATAAYRMGDPYDAWFSACLGYRAILVYIGDRGREVLAHRPSEHRLWRRPQQQQQGGWLSSISAYIPGVGGGGGAAGGRDEGGPEQLTFNEIAPFLVASKASLRNVSDRLPEGEEMDMRRFRPNIVVDEAQGRKGREEEEEEEEEEEGEGEEEEGKALEAWEEDYWAELSITRGGTGEQHRLALTANCGRCISINIDYDTGRPSQGEPGIVLKKLMADRRVDQGNKYAPIFGRYAFLAPGEDGSSSDDGVEIAVGDEIRVTKRLDYRDSWAWPKH